MSDDFSWTKMVVGIPKAKTAAKSFVIGLWLVIFVLSGFTIYKAFFVKTKTEEYSQQAENITNVENYNYQKKRHHVELLWGAIRIW